jgi:hypothetical protein
LREKHQRELAQLKGTLDGRREALEKLSHEARVGSSIRSGTTVSICRTFRLHVVNVLHACLLVESWQSWRRSQADASALAKLRESDLLAALAAMAKELEDARQQARDALGAAQRARAENEDLREQAKLSKVHSLCSPSAVCFPSLPLHRFLWLMRNIGIITSSPTHSFLTLPCGPLQEREAATTIQNCRLSEEIQRLRDMIKDLKDKAARAAAAAASAAAAAASVPKVCSRPVHGEHG